jgi:hypothetical protein
MALLFENKFEVSIASADQVSLEPSKTKWSLYLKDITLKQSFDGLFPRVFNPNNEIYLYIICWDYSGKAPFVYPMEGIKPEDFKIKIKKNETHYFFGDGLQLWLPSTIVGSLNVAIMLMEDDSDVRKAGEILVDIRKAVNKSKLFELIGAVASNPATITGVAIAKAVVELTGLIGSIMSKNKNDYINLFQACYGVEKHQTSGIKPYKHRQAEMNLEMIIGENI